MEKNILSLNKPVWFMRQAGRHLPEYLRLRKKSNSFLDFCFNYESIIESTLQPIRRYDLDCAIIFSDILVIPYILNQKIEFKEGVGPILHPINSSKDLTLKVNITKNTRLKNTYDAIAQIRKKLNKNKALIGFCGGPWTVACYMIDGSSKTKFMKSRSLLKKDKSYLLMLLDIIVDVSVNHLEKQYLSGCDTLMIFESWAGLVPKNSLGEILYNPTKKIIYKLREKNITAPIICFPKGINKEIISYNKEVQPDVLSVDHNIDIQWLIKNIKEETILQGNINPNTLLQGGKDLIRETLNLKSIVKERKHIFNLGHGILPKTPIENVLKAIELIRA